MALCGKKEKNGTLVDDQICLCDTDLCNALWKKLGEAANALKCYRYDDDGDDICIVDEDCTDKSEIITCSGGNDTCGWTFDVS